VTLPVTPLWYGPPARNAASIVAKGGPMEVAIPPERSPAGQCPDGPRRPRPPPGSENSPGGPEAPQSVSGHRPERLDWGGTQDGRDGLRWQSERWSRQTRTERRMRAAAIIPGRDRQRQKRRKACRCQRRSVAGWTIVSASRHAKQRARRTRVSQSGSDAPRGFTKRTVTPKGGRARELTDDPRRSAPILMSDPGDHDDRSR
jgi:hypothetical protein